MSWIRFTTNVDIIQGYLHEMGGQNNSPVLSTLSNNLFEIITEEFDVRLSRSAYWGFDIGLHTYIPNESPGKSIHSGCRLVKKNYLAISTKCDCKTG
jgi:hypothetical protein